MSQQIHDFTKWLLDTIYDDSLPLGGGGIGGAIASNSEPSYTHIMIGATIGAIIGYLVKKILDFAFAKLEKRYGK